MSQLYSILSSFPNKIKRKINYFGDESNLHGIGYLFSMSHIPSLKRLFWLTILISCCHGAAVILQASLNLYFEGSVSYSVETNYLDFDTPFPAVTVCEYMDPDRIKAYFIQHNLPISLTSFYKDVGFWNPKYCRSCNNCRMNQTCLEDIEKVVKNFKLKCRELMTDCWLYDKKFHCCDRFHPIQTEYGLCYVFNSRLTGNGSKVITINRRVGLPRLIFSAKVPIIIRVHSPDDVVSVALENILGRSALLPLVTDFEAILKVEQTISDLSLDSLSSSIRSCLFKHEQPAFAHLWPFRKYSYSACVLYCRAVEQVDLCNCTHHFMPKLGTFPACDIQGLACLYKNKDLLTDVDCECPMGCEEILYNDIHIFFNRHTGNIPEELISRGTRGVIRVAQLPALRVRRHAIRDMLGLVVDIGGVVGVFFGASLLSVIEIFYIFFIRRGP